MTLLKHIITSPAVYMVRVRNLQERDEIRFKRVDLVFYVDNSKLGEWIDKPVLARDYNPLDLSLTLFI